MKVPVAPLGPNPVNGPDKVHVVVVPSKAQDPHVMRLWPWPDALGPSLKGVLGRKSAAMEDFRYSNPMKRANLVWDEANLREYIADPQAKVRGNRMPFDGLHDPKDVEDIVAYLKTYK